MGIPDARLVCGRLLLLRDVFCGRVSHDGVRQVRGSWSNADRSIDGCECRMESHFLSATLIAMEFLVLRAIYRARGRSDKGSVVRGQGLHHVASHLFGVSALRHSLVLLRHEIECVALKPLDRRTHFRPVTLPPWNQSKLAATNQSRQSCTRAERVRSPV